jgi:5-methylcytosine-specific restriction endonuclease McrA
MRGERTVIKQRDSYYALSDYKPKVNGDGQKLCLNCGEVLGSRKRKYCSDKCSHEWFRKHYWSAMKEHILTAQNYVCQKCGATPPRNAQGYLEWTNDHSSLDYFDYVVDHKIPIALGGEEFDENNLQVLCGPCNRIKTKEDMQKIAKKRRETKLIYLENEFEVEGFSHVFQNTMFISLDMFLV